MQHCGDIYLLLFIFIIILEPLGHFKCNNIFGVWILYCYLY